MSIYEFIPRDRFITREELVRVSGLGDRFVRRQINELRKNPATVIISSSHKKGYKRPSCIEEIELCLNESKSRVKDEMEKQRVLEKAMRDFKKNEINGQLLFDF